MPDFMSGLAKGIEKSKGMVASAMDGVTADMVVNPKISTADTKWNLRWSICRRYPCGHYHSDYRSTGGCGR